MVTPELSPKDWDFIKTLLDCERLRNEQDMTKFKHTPIKPFLELVINRVDYLLDKIDGKEVPENYYELEAEKLGKKFNEK